ncbi:MAG: glycosyltransferase, partial [Firmicutes bacterium]|nr:glycosyltransferase [Bacillota bacterium]
EYIQALDLSDVIFPGHISFAEILAFYRVADIFLCMSEHEGFCVPLVEAMMFDVPIIAYASSAIPDTLGDAGVLIDEKDPVLVSKIIDQIVSDPDIRRRLIDIQRERLKDFHEDIVFEKIYRVVSSFRGEDLT